MRVHFQINWQGRARRSMRAVIIVASAAATITVVAEQTLRVPPLPPGAEKVATPPMPPSPVDNFRDWLKLSPQQRSLLLGQLPEAERKLLEAKLASYDTLPPDARDLRLRETQLHWHLLGLMKISPAQRKYRLAQVPPEDRELVQERLKQWDALPPEKQKTFLDHEEVIGVYLQLQETPQTERGQVLANMPSDIRLPLEKRLQLWNRMPPPQRQELSDRFTQLFRSVDGEREKLAAELPEDVRKPFEKLSGQLDKLPPDQRQKCTAALNKFLKMPAEDQRKFLQNAMRWQTLSEKERDGWRQVVPKVPQLPPLPPGFAPPPLVAGTNSVVPANTP
jgi:hypothetical protein